MDIKLNSAKQLTEPVWGWDPVIQIAYHAKHFRPETYQLIIVDERIVGYFSVYQTASNLLFLEAIVIIDDFQRKGIGSIILDNLRKIASQDSFEIELHVQKNNLMGKKFFLKKGFSVSTHSVTHYKMKYVPEKSVNYEL
ncbi:MAG: GNAT family N-acetyltransferase [Sediminibacterium sp.]